MFRFGLIGVLALMVACSGKSTGREENCVAGEDCSQSDGQNGDTPGDTNSNNSPTPEPEPQYEWPDSSQDYLPEKLSVITSLKINEDDNKANFFGKLLVILGNEGTDPNTLFAGFIENGSLVTALDHREFTDDENNILVTHMQGKWNENATWDSVREGNAFIYLTTDSYRSDTGHPKAIFQSSELDGPELFAQNADMTFKLPEGDYLESVVVHDANVMCSNVEEVGPGYSYSEGVIEGYVTIKEFFVGLNSSLAERCSCLGITEDILLETEEAGTYTCNTSTGDLNACVDTEDYALCEFTMNQCNLLLMLVDRGDLDKSEEIGGNDAMSFRVDFEAKPAGFSGIRNP